MERVPAWVAEQPRGARLKVCGLNRTVCRTLQLAMAHRIGVTQDRASSLAGPGVTLRCTFGAKGNAGRPSAGRSAGSGDPRTTRETSAQRGRPAHNAGPVHNAWIGGHRATSALPMTIIFLPFCHKSRLLAYLRVRKVSAGLETQRPENRIFLDNAACAGQRLELTSIHSVEEPTVLPRTPSEETTVQPVPAFRPRFRAGKNGGLFHLPDPSLLRAASLGPRHSASSFWTWNTMIACTSVGTRTGTWPRN